MNLISQVKNIIIKAGKLSQELQNSKGIINISSKKDNNTPVTNVDKKLSDFIYDNLQQINYDIPIICEEKYNKSDFLQKEYIQKGDFWLVDPIDGTKSYIKNESTYTINIALIQKHEPVLGFIYHPFNMMLYYTDLNNKLCVEKEDTIINFEYLPRLNNSTTAIFGSDGYDNNISQMLLKKYHINNISIIPSALKLAYIATCQADIAIRNSGHKVMPWDIAAGDAIINASGGKFTNMLEKKILYGINGELEETYYICFSKDFISNMS